MCSLSETAAAARQLLAIVLSYGVEVSRAEGDRLQIRPASKLPREVLEQVRHHKAELLALVSPSGEGEASWPDLWTSLDRLRREVLALQQAILAEGQRRGYPAVPLGPGRTLKPGRQAWEAFIHASFPNLHRDGLELIRWLIDSPPPSHS